VASTQTSLSFTSFFIFFSMTFLLCFASRAGTRGDGYTIFAGRESNSFGP
jgi:hypothetical protein